MQVLKHGERVKGQIFGKSLKYPADLAGRSKRDPFKDGKCFICHGFVIWRCVVVADIIRKPDIKPGMPGGLDEAPSTAPENPASAGWANRVTSVQNILCAMPTHA
jgi:hypothetical protein